MSIGLYCYYWFCIPMCNNPSGISNNTYFLRWRPYRGTASLSLCFLHISITYGYHYDCVICGWDATCEMPVEWKNHMGVFKLKLIWFIIWFMQLLIAYVHAFVMYDGPWNMKLPNYAPLHCRPHGVYYLRLLWTVLPTSPPTGTTTTVSYADGMPRARCQWNGRIRWACTIYLTKTPNPSTMSWWTMGPYVMLRKVHNNIPCLFYV